MNEIQLGAMYRDKLSGFIGRAYSITSYWAGCDRVVLQPPVGEDGKRSETENFDVPQLERLDEPVVAPPVLGVVDKTGGDRPIPTGRG